MEASEAPLDVGEHLISLSLSATLGNMRMITPTRYEGKGKNLNIKRRAGYKPSENLALAFESKKRKIQVYSEKKKSRNPSQHAAKFSCLAIREGNHCFENCGSEKILQSSALRACVFVRLGPGFGQPSHTTLRGQVPARAWGWLGRTQSP